MIVVVLIMVIFVMITFAIEGVAFLRRRLKAVLQRKGQARNEDSEVSPDVALFISYSRQDERKVSTLIEELERSGVKTWFDKRHQADSRRFVKRIVQAIRTSRACAFMCSSAAYQSDHVIRELHLADKYKKPMVPVEIEPGPLTDDFEYFSLG